ncbi:MAG: hypothetical protein HZC49_13195, partial [Nitrospirae bacterium]|nr:hypothetical protein [Nitrospirota bacterium]
MSDNISDTPGASLFCEIKPERVNIEPFTMVIFGGGGDLSRRKLLPTLYHLCHDQNLPGEYSIIAFASTERTNDEYRDLIKKSVEEFNKGPFNETCWENFSRHLFYVSGKFDDVESYKKLSQRIEDVAKPTAGGKREVIYYLAVPP